MIIDAHSHGFHGKSIGKIADAGGEWTKRIIAREVEQAKQRPMYLDVGARLAVLDKHGIDCQVVTPTALLDVNAHPGDITGKLAIASALNDNMARLMADSRGRLIAIGTIPLESMDDGGLQEMERAIKTLGLGGIGIFSHVRGEPIDAPQFESFWALAAELDVPVWIHPINPVRKNDRPYEAEYHLALSFGWPFETTLSLCRLAFSGIMDRFPNLKVVGHHLGGGMIAFFWGRIMEIYDPVNQPKLLGKTMAKPLADYFSLFYYDTAVGGHAPAIRCAYDVLGAKQLVFATDSPFGPADGERGMATYPGVIRSLCLSEAENEAILAGNARRILRI